MTKDTSIRTYEQIYDSYIKPALGGMHLAKIKTPYIQKLVNSLVDDELSPKFIKGIMQRSEGIFNAVNF